MLPIARVGMLAVMMLIMGVLAACGGGGNYKPQAINEETDRCVICNMAIKDDVYATQIITKDGQSLKFDDLGCLNEWKVRNGTDTIGAAFVRDYNSGEWLKYEKAYYAYDSSFKTPMAYGLLSFESKEEAEAYIADQNAGKLMTAEDLTAHSWEVNHEMMGGEHSHDHDAAHDGEQEDEQNAARDGKREDEHSAARDGEREDEHNAARDGEREDEHNAARDGEQDHKHNAQNGDGGEAEPSSGEHHTDGSQS
ncbi:hypothetical protein EBB07_17860 [Paenibacillaceae bacterium]|nr:hypothetical protein EBB07_17860 [Paenibacillaceae bacterium]